MKDSYTTEDLRMHSSALIANNDDHLSELAYRALNWAADRIVELEGKFGILERRVYTHMADQYAKVAHEGQLRKYSGHPYIEHPRRVASLVSTVVDQDTKAGNDMICAALLHDTVEDTHVTHEHILKTFGNKIQILVYELTDIATPEDGNRKVRKQIECDRLAKVSHFAQTIKLADLIDNSRSIIRNDPDFAPTFVTEMEALLEVLVRGDRGFRDMAKEICRKYRESK